MPIISNKSRFHDSHELLKVECIGFLESIHQFHLVVGYTSTYDRPAGLS
eukprot:COSAG02_NODE_42034_length_388_cov_1.062284_1_plen_48_part_10